MKIKNSNAGALTNFEVLDFLKSRGASKDSSRVIAPIAPSEYKVYDYLLETPACVQTREQISEFMEKCKEFDLTKAEILNIINVRPTCDVEIDALIVDFDTRLPGKLEEILQLVELLPLPPSRSKFDAEIDENIQEAGDEEQNDKANKSIDE